MYIMIFYLQCKYKTMSSIDKNGRGPMLAKNSRVDKDTYVILQLTTVGCIGKHQHDYVLIYNQENIIY